MTIVNDSEEDIAAEARGILGEQTDIIAAGHFGLANLIAAQVAGGTVGSIAGGALNVDAALDAGIGVGLGGLAAVKASAEAQGVTMKMIVAITPDEIHLLNRETGGRLRSDVIAFRRNSVDIHIAKFGLSRILTLTDRGSGHSVELHGTVSWLSSQAKGDKVVLDLLAHDATAPTAI
ncbi:hypothetical protein [Microbacterium sp. Bi128]|uniref:hypothetical protein n=1 Tax=Microbacterium sp. Bi128 TaxID=2821115 RepID=UPI001D37BBAA|nr:hypothetical protein [Microbacterium sp. Bi128]CAH0239399.1 hypothetical protein SRABI128_02641 [Microbacterium sp. Bi128]